MKVDVVDNQGVVVESEISMSSESSGGSLDRGDIGA